MFGSVPITISPPDKHVLDNIFERNINLNPANNTHSIMFLYHGKFLESIYYWFISGFFWNPLEPAREVSGFRDSSESWRQSHSPLLAHQSNLHPLDLEPAT